MPGAECGLLGARETPGAEAQHGLPQCSGLYLQEAYQVFTMKVQERPCLLCQGAGESNHSERGPEASPHKWAALRGERLHQSLISPQGRAFPSLVLMIKSQKNLIWGTAHVVWSGGEGLPATATPNLGHRCGYRNKIGSGVELNLRASVMRGASTGPRQANQDCSKNVKTSPVERIPLWLGTV